MEFFEVGGAVRDRILGLDSKDVDFVCTAISFEEMRNELQFYGFKIFLETPEFVTIRAEVPQSHPLRKRTKVADFVLARKDSATSDGRRPDFVEPGTLLDDLARRDFTCNAIAIDPVTNEYIDPFNGINAIKSKTLQFVGDPHTRIKEDGLRVLRGFRFQVTKGFTASYETYEALRSELACEMLSKVSEERIHDELMKMFQHDTCASMALLSALPRDIQHAIFRGRVRLIPTLRA